MSHPTFEKNKAIVLLKKVGMPMNEIIRAFGDDDRGSKKWNYYRVWRRDKNKYLLPSEKRSAKIIN